MNNEVFRSLTNMKSFNHIYQTSISNVRVDDIGYKLYVFDIRYKENVRAAQPNKVEFQLDAVVPNDINGYASVVTCKLASV